MGTLGGAARRGGGGGGGAPANARATIEVPDDPRGDARATVVGGAEGETGRERMGEREREARSASVAGVELDLDALFE